MKGYFMEKSDKKRNFIDIFNNIFSYRNTDGYEFTVAETPEEKSMFNDDVNKSSQNTR